MSAASPQVSTGIESALSAQDAWDELVHKDDRTSPEEYPDHCLISFDELQDFMSRSRDVSPANVVRSSQDPAAWIAFAANGNVRFWTSDPHRTQREKERGLDLRAFTMAELIALISRLPAPQPTLETCQRCMGSGYSNHPDSGEICEACGGDGAARSGAPAQGQSDCGEPDLKFANEQNIKAARKYKARLDFMEAKYGAIDWEADVTAQPTQGGDKGEAVACVCQGQHRRGYCTEPGCPYAAPQPASNAYASPIPRADADETKNGWRLDFKWLDNMSRQIEKKTGFSVTQECVEEAVLRTEALLIPSTPSATPPDWKQDQAETSRLAPKLPSTHQTTEAK